MSSSENFRCPGVRRLCELAGLALLAGAVNVSAQERPGLRVSVDDERVSVEAHDVPVRHILEEISRQADLEVVTRDPLSEHISVELEGLSMLQAMRRILKERSYNLSHVASREGRITRLWILSADPGGFATSSTQLTYSGSTTAVAPQIAEDQDLATLAAEALNHGDPAARVEAVYALSEIGPGNTRILEQALVDPSTRVRESAIEALADIGGTESASALGVALNDAEASIRLEAVEALGEIGGETAAALLRKALVDEATRETAAELLADLAEHR